MPLYERFDAIARWLLIGLVGFLPFFFIPITWISVTQGKIALTSLTLFVVALLWGIARYLEGGVRIPWSVTIVASALIPIAYAFSTAVHGLQPLSLVGNGVESDTLALVCIGFSLLVLSASVFAGQSAPIIHALRAFFAGSLIALIFQVVHFALPQLNLGGVFATTTGNAFGTWHEFSMLLGAILFLGIALQHSSVARGLWRLVLYASAGLAGIVLLMAGFLDVWGSVVFAFLAFVAVRGYKAQSFGSFSFWRSEWLPLAIAIVALMCAVLGSFIANALPERISVTHVEVRPSWRGTAAIGKETFTRSADVFFGSGPNTFTREWGLHKPIEVNQTLFWNSDFSVGVASLPTSFITTGILGALAWLLFLLTAAWAILRLWFFHGGTASDTIAVAALYLLALHTFSIPGTALTLLTFLVLGLLIASLTPNYFALRRLSFSEAGYKRYAYAAGVTLFTLISLLAASGLLRVLVADTLVNRAITTYSSTLDVARTSAIIAEAIRVYPSDRAHRTAVELGLLRLRELVQQADPDQEAAQAQLQSTLEATIRHGLAAVSIDGGAYQNWLGLAALYAELAGSNVEGAYDNARAAYERALAENPTSPLPLLNLARLELLQNKPDQALIQLDKAVQLKPDFAAAYYLASQAYAAQNDLQNAMRAAAKAVENAQADAQAWYNFGLIAYTANEYQQAATALEQALTRQEKFANAMYILGLSHYELKRPEDATKMFEALLQLDPDQASVKQVLENLRSGRPPITPAAATSTPVQPR